MDEPGFTELVAPAPTYLDTGGMIPATRYAQARDGVRIAYQTFGDGERDLLYVPGLITHLELHWEEPRYAEFLSGLGSMARVIAIDRRGVGLSDRLSPDDLPPLEVIMDDLLTVLDEVGSRRTTLIGHDEGGQIAALTAATHPDRVDALVLYATAPNLAGRPDAPWSAPEGEWEEWIAWTVEHYGSRESAIRDLQETTSSGIANEDEVQWVARMYRYGVSPTAFVALHRLSMRIDVTDVLSSIRVPTLVVHREEDPSVNIEAARFISATVPSARLIELRGGGHFPNQGDVGQLLDAIRRFVKEVHGAPEDGTRRLATVMFTDIVGSTVRAAELGDAKWTQLLEAHHARVREEVQRHGGQEIDTTGDGFLAAFDGPARAIRCAIAIRESLRPLDLDIRAGLHTGEVEAIFNRLRGIAVHIGARVSSIANPGAVFVTSTVRDLVAGSGIEFEDRGEHELKGVPGKWHLFEVVADDGEAPTGS
jgi:pimeloyl-ACP methyl ester carboxylesterase